MILTTMSSLTLVLWLIAILIRLDKVEEMLEFAKALILVSRTNGNGK